MYRYNYNEKALLLGAILVVLLIVFLAGRIPGVPAPTQNQTVYVDVKDYPSPKVYISVEKIGLVTDNGIYFVSMQRGLKVIFPPDLSTRPEMVSMQRGLKAVLFPLSKRRISLGLNAKRIESYN